MHYKRHYVQFNELVFDEVEMITEDTSSVAFKQTSQEYGFTHGAYAPRKTRTGLVRSGSVSFTITLRMKKLPCEHRPYYRRHVLSQLSEPGKLWAVQDNTLVWAYAYMSEYSESTNPRRDTLEIDVELELPEGVWHKANKQKTFLTPYDVCDFMDCYDFKDVNPCKADCCTCAPNLKPYCHCCECDHITKDMALCYHTNDLQSFYSCHGSGYKIVYDCASAERFFGDVYGDTPLGQKFCDDCGLIAGLLYSDTDLDTNGITIRLHGKFSDPMIEINGNANIIKGDFDGYMTVYPDGSVTSGNDCGECSTLDVGAWIVPEGNTYGWTINPGNNRLVIEASCCDVVCAYITIDSLTI